LRLQKALQEVLEVHDFLVNCLGAEVTAALERRALGALSESQPALKHLSKRLVSLFKKTQKCTAISY